jgi:hypothetical protein
MILGIFFLNNLFLVRNRKQVEDGTAVMMPV